MATDERLDELANIAAQLSARVRDDDPAAVGRWLEAVAPTSADRWALLFVLAAAVPLDRPFAHLVAWVRTVAVEHDEVIEQRRAILLGEHVGLVGVAA
jgi:hypothetical protein